MPIYSQAYCISLPENLGHFGGLKEIGKLTITLSASDLFIWAN